MSWYLKSIPVITMGVFLSHTGTRNHVNAPHEPEAQKMAYPCNFLFLMQCMRQPSLLHAWMGKWDYAHPLSESVL